MNNKTSIRGIDDDVYWSAKVYAVETRQTMGEVVTLALERLVNEEWWEDCQISEAEQGSTGTSAGNLSV